MYEFHLRTIYPYLGSLPSAAWTSVSLSVLAISLGLLIGLGGALLRSGKSPAARWSTTVYVEFMRNTPLIVLLYLVFFGLPQIGIRLGGYGSALIALTLNCSAYMMEIFRGGLIAIPHGQYEAAAAQGMTFFQTFRYIVLPQLTRIVYAPLGNTFIQVLLGSSLASVVAVNELTDWMENVGSDTFRFFETFLVAGFVYVTLCQMVNFVRILVGRSLMKSWPS
jgi:polar amino acid transport system permease protein